MPAPLDIPSDGLPGLFWIKDGPRARGMLRWGDGDRPVVVTEGVIREAASIRVTRGPGYASVEHLGGPREIVADSIPVSILGQLDDGPAVTLRGSMLLNPIFPAPQTHQGLGLLVGVHASPGDERFEAARFLLPGATVWRSLFNTEPETVAIGEAQGHLSAYVDDEGVWLNLSVGNGLSVREWERLFWYRCCIFISIWTNDEIRPGRVQLRSSGQDEWADQVRRHVRGAGAFDWASSLLPPGDLTLRHLADAIRDLDAWGTVAEIASKDWVHGTTIQTAVFLYASALEGLHHHCNLKRKPFPSLSNTKAKRVAQAAAKAAVGSADGLGADLGPPQDAQRRIFESFKYFNQLSFEERLHELLPAVEQAAPGLIGQDRQLWVEWVAAARNQEAHRRPKIAWSSLEQEENHYYQLAVSTQWALRLSVLTELGVDNNALRQGLAGHQRFLLALANMDRDGTSWPGSRLDEFIAGATRQG